jgi:hypothetical protein
MERMNREQFYAAMAGLDEERLRKALWTLYWRGAAPVRQRIEAELAPPDQTPRTRSVAEAVDPEAVLEEVQRFVSLARSGSYLAGDRQVSPKERTRWRFTFRRLVADSRQALRADDIAPAVEAVAAMVDLACAVRDYDYFRSDDPVEAAGVVVSDEVGVLWARMLEQRGFPAFAQEAAGQFVRWEAPFGWTRAGFGRVSEKESSLTTVLAGMLPVPDAWVTFVGCYLIALDEAAPAPGAHCGSRRSADREGARRAEALAEWNEMLLDRFVGTDDEASSIAWSPARACRAELTYVQAQPPPSRSRRAGVQPDGRCAGQAAGPRGLLARPGDRRVAATCAPDRRGTRTVRQPRHGSPAVFGLMMGDRTRPGTGRERRRRRWPGCLIAGR